jgi:hypothetical protein
VAAYAGAFMSEVISWEHRGETADSFVDIFLRHRRVSEK